MAVTSQDYTGESVPNSLNELNVPSTKSLAVLILSLTGSCASLPTPIQQPPQPPENDPPVAKQPILEDSSHSEIPDGVMASVVNDLSDVSFMPNPVDNVLPQGKPIEEREEVVTEDPWQLANDCYPPAETMTPEVPNAGGSAQSSAQVAPVEAAQHEPLPCECVCKYENGQKERNGLKDKILYIGAIAMAGIAFVGSARGAAKVVDWIWRYLKDRVDFVTGRSLASPTINLHTFKQAGDETKIKVRAIDKPELPTIFHNTYAQKIFQRAAKLCSESQPFPSFNLEEADSSWALWRRNNGYTTTPRALAVLREINKLFRDYYSSLYKAGIVADEFGVADVEEDFHFLIPICEVNPRIGRDLSFIALSDSNFERFGDAQQVQKLNRDNPHLGLRLWQLVEAYKLHKEYLEVPEKQRNEFLFPRINVAVKTRGQNMLNI